MARLDEISDPQLRELAHAEYNELLAAEEQHELDQAEIVAARREFHDDMQALGGLQQHFANFPGFSEFAAFISSGELTPEERENVYAVFNTQIATNGLTDLKMELMVCGLPSNRQSYQIFTDTFGIATSAERAELTDANSEAMRVNFLAALPLLQEVANDRAVRPLVVLITELETATSVDLRDRLQAVIQYLVGPDGQGGELDVVLDVLQQQDRANAGAGRPTRHFERFTQSLRRVSPDLSARVDQYIIRRERVDTNTTPSAERYQQVLVAGALPE